MVEKPWRWGGASLGASAEPLLAPSPHGRKALSLWRKSSKPPSPEGTGEDSLSQGKQTNKNCCSGRVQVYILGLDL